MSTTILAGDLEASNESIRRRITELRSRSFPASVETESGAMAPRRLVSRLKRGETVLILCNTHLSSGAQSVHVDLLGRRTRVPRGAGWMAVHSGAHLLPVALLDEPARRHRIVIGPEIEGLSDASLGSRIDATNVAVFRVLERLVLEHPGQWCKWTIMEPSTPTGCTTPRTPREEIHGR